MKVWVLIGMVNMEEFEVLFVFASLEGAEWQKQALERLPEAERFSAYIIEESKLLP